MKGYSFHSDSEESAAIEEVLSQAHDLSVLEQISAINCSGIPSDAALPPDLDARFRRLKTFPSRSDRSRSDSIADAENAAAPKQHPPRSEGEGSTPKTRRAGSVSSNSKSPSEGKSYGKKDPQPKSKSGSSVAAASSASPAQDSIFSPLNEILVDHDKRRSKSRPFPPPLSLSDSSRNSSPSPPQKPGCFWCSPGKVSRKKSKENRIAGTTWLDWDNNEEILSDLGSFSVREQKKLLKNIAREEEKINREAEKIVKWAKQASAKMNISDEDEREDFLSASQKLEMLSMAHRGPCNPSQKPPSLIGKPLNDDPFSSSVLAENFLH